MHILVIEDSAPTRELLERSLRAGGHDVVLVGRATAALRAIGEAAFDLLIVDIMLPDGSGLDLCREIRRRGVAAPILFLTARGEVGDRVAGLDAGGDDYLRKPFALAELHARIRALARRQGLAPPSSWRRGEIVADFTARSLRHGAHEVPLTGREWEVLELLAARAGRVVSREDLLDRVWGDCGPGAAGSLEVIVSRLRRKLGADGETSLIRTVRGRGYALEASA